MQATIAIDRNTGIILKKTGDISFSNSLGTRPSNTASNGLDDSSKDTDEVHGIEEMAMMVWKFVQAAGTLVQGLDTEVGGLQDCKYFRLMLSFRMKSNSFVYEPRNMN